MVITCHKCAISSFCDFRGSSPTRHGDKIYLCDVIGGYAQSPIDPQKLSEDLRVKYETGKTHLSLVSINIISGEFIFPRLVKIMHPKLKEAPKRETIHIMKNGTNGTSR